MRTLAILVASLSTVAAFTGRALQPRNQRAAGCWRPSSPTKHCEVQRQRTRHLIMSASPPVPNVPDAAKKICPGGSCPIPKFRGKLHRNGAFILPVAGGFLLDVARRAKSDNPLAIAHALVFTLSVEAILATSGLLHTTDWLARARENRVEEKLVAKIEVARAQGRKTDSLEQQLEALREAPIYHPPWIRLADYSMIFLGIAGIYSSMGAQIIGDTMIYRRVILPLVWTSAAAGISSKVLFINSPRWVEAVAFLSMGWSCVLGYNKIRASLTLGQWMWMLAGGLCFSVGTSAYVLQWPDFKWHQDFFRAHEAFHLGTIGGFGCFFALMWSLFKASVAAI